MKISTKVEEMLNAQNKIEDCQSDDEDHSRSITMKLSQSEYQVVHNLLMNSYMLQR